MGEVSTIGLDIATSVFQVHGVGDAGAVVIRRRISRAKVLEFFGGLSPCLVGIEACPSAHHWTSPSRWPVYPSRAVHRGRRGAHSTHMSAFDPKRTSVSGRPQQGTTCAEPIKQ